MGTKTNMKPYNPINWPAVPHDFTGDNVLGMYTAETTQRYIPGTRFLRWDGSVFKYGRLKGGSVLGMGIFNKSGVVNIGGNATSNMVAGSRTMSFLLGGDDGYGGGGVAEDELIGGYIFSSTTTRLIMGNNAAVVSTGTVIVTVDAPYHKAATLPWTEIMLNPYNYLAAAAPAMPSVPLWVYRLLCLRPVTLSGIRLMDPVVCSVAVLLAMQIISGRCILLLMVLSEMVPNSQSRLAGKKQDIFSMRVVAPPVVYRWSFCR